MPDRYADYIPAAERLKEFWERFPEGRVVTSISEHDRESGFILMHAALYRSTQETEPDELDEVQARDHIAELSTMYNELVKQKAQRAAERREPR